MCHNVIHTNRIFQAFLACRIVHQSAQKHVKNSVCCWIMQLTPGKIVKNTLNESVAVNCWFFTYFSWMQDYLVQATYWHNPFEEDEYRKYSTFLADINNELTINQTYVENLRKLNKWVGDNNLMTSYWQIRIAFGCNWFTLTFDRIHRFVLVKFSEDTIVQPIDTEWFQFYTPNQDKVIQPLAESNAAVSFNFDAQQLSCVSAC